MFTAASSRLACFGQEKDRSMTMSTIWPWQAPALLAKVLDEPEIAASRTARRGTGADHRHDVLAADGARQSAQARRDPALQAPCRTILGGIRPGGLAWPEAAHERHPSGGGRRHG